jgi:hypothetical protein
MSRITGAKITGRLHHRHTQRSCRKTCNCNSFDSGGRGLLTAVCLAGHVACRFDQFPILINFILISQFAAIEAKYDFFLDLSSETVRPLGLLETVGLL